MKIIITEKQLEKVIGWKTKGDKFYKKYQLDSYKEVVDLFNKFAKESEKQNHHADLLVKYDSIEVFLIDHEVGKISEKCHNLASAFEKIYNKIK
jgi:4a-hydroxytetrahydrobiopterin dehydratase